MRKKPFILPIFFWSYLGFAVWSLSETIRSAQILATSLQVVFALASGWLLFGVSNDYSMQKGVRDDQVV